MSIVLRRGWRPALRGLWRLRRDTSDIGAVMLIIQSLEGRSIWRSFDRMMASPEGRVQAFARIDLAPRLSDQAWLAQFQPGTLGAAYREFIGERFSAAALSEDLKRGPNGASIRGGSAVAWFARRICDLHDVAHVLTGYAADARGEGCLQGFTFAQLGAWGYLAIAIGSALLFGPAQVINGYLRGRRAKWLFDMDVEAAFAEPLADVRARLKISA